MGATEGKFEQVKGHAKEAVGDVTDDDDLKREGKADRAGGKLKEAVRDAADTVDRRIDNVKDKFKKN